MTTAYFIIRNGELQSKKAVREVFESLKDGIYELAITRKSKRTVEQNAYFHHIMPIIQHGLYDAGYRHITNPQRAKRFVKKLFLTEIEENELTGEKVEVTRDTHELSKEEFGRFLDEIVQWAAEYLSIVIPSPGEQILINYE